MTEREIQAAEYVLRLLDGEALLDARRLLASDAAFAAEVASWENRLAPLFDDVAAVEPGAALWERVRQAIAERDRSPGSVAVIGRRLGYWRAAAVAASGIAASLALVMVFDSTRSPIVAPAPTAPVLVASLSGTGDPTSLSVAIQPDRGELLVTPGRLSPAAGHDHELWLIPQGGSPRSLGLVRGGQPQRLQIAADLVPEMRAMATLALSVEPVGGSPTGLPTGAVVAQGQLARL